MKRSSHHYHVVLDDKGKPLPHSLEHEHLVNPGRRHVHRRSAEAMVPKLLEQGVSPEEARRIAAELDGTAYTTLDFARPPLAPTVNERAVARSLHPEVRRGLS